MYDCDEVRAGSARRWDRSWVQARVPRLALIWLVVVGCACGPAGESYSDQGQLCSATDVDGAVQVMLLLPICLRGGCDRVLEKSCSVEVDGSTLRVRSHWEVEHKGNGCRDSCDRDPCSAMIEGLEPGRYTLIYGEESLPIDVPSDEISFINADRSGRLWCEIEFD